MRFLKNLGQASILAMMMSGAVSAQTIEGTVTVNDNEGLGQGPVTMAEGATIVAGADNLVLENDIAINGRGNVDTDGNTTTLAGILSDGGVDELSLAGQLRKFGAGHWSFRPPIPTLAARGCMKERWRLPIIVPLVRVR